MRSVRSGRCSCCAGSASAAACTVSPTTPISQSTGYRYLHEGIDVRRRRGALSHDVLQQCLREGATTHMILDGRLIQIVRKWQRRLTGVDEMMLSLSAKGLTYGEISAYLADVYGAEVSKQTVSTIADKVIEGMAEWQNRPLDRVYPVLFVDAINGRSGTGRSPTDRSTW